MPLEDKIIAIESKDLSHNYPAPDPLRAALPAAAPYPVHALGDILRNATMGLHEDIKAPLALCAQSVLGAASFSAQSHFDVMLPWGEIKPLSLFLLTIGESGERKSGVDGVVLAADKAQERDDLSAHNEEAKEYEQDAENWRKLAESVRKKYKGETTPAAIREAINKVCGPEPRPPIYPIRFVSDPTIEGLYKLLACSQPSVALFSDEGGLLIGGHAMNQDNALKTMARWCQLWDGSPYDRARAGDGSGKLYGRRMALHQLAQPDVMASLLSDRMANGQGFLARCLVAWPASTIGSRQITEFVDPKVNPAAKRLFAVLKTLAETQPLTSETNIQELTPTPLEIAAEAKPMALAALNEFESLMREGGELHEIRDRANKAIDNACRIAGVLAVRREAEKRIPKMSSFS